MMHPRVLVSIFIGLALAAFLLLVLAFWPSRETPSFDPDLEPLAPLPAPHDPRQPPAPVPDMNGAVPAIRNGSTGNDVIGSRHGAEATHPQLPPLDDSDAFVREQTSGVCLPLAWMVADSLVRRASVLIENASRGDLPPRRGGLLPPLDTFPVRRSGDRIFMDEAGYERFSPYLDELEAVHPHRLAGCIRTLEPLLRQALQELGYADGPRSGIVAAIDQILAMPELIEGLRFELVQPKVLYQYANTRLESMSSLQKQVLRMGPRNVRRLKAYLRRLAPLLSDAPRI